MGTNFFTNEKENTLLEKIEGVFKYKKVHFFDALVGYFRASGYFRIRKFIQQTPHIRILVGINVDKLTYQANQQGLLFNPNDEQSQEEFFNDIKKNIQEAKYDKEVEDGMYQFIEDIVSGRIEMRIHPKQNIHAKIYIFREEVYHPHGYGSVITGSSNLTEAGLEKNFEFNVELRYDDDIQFATETFEKLWAESVAIDITHIEKIKKESYLNTEFTPYEVYLKFLLEYFGRSIDFDPNSVSDLPKGYKKLSYQVDAVNDGYSKMMKHNGFFLSDVVGLGKTIVAALIAKKFFFANGFPMHRSHTLIIVPPALKEGWERTMTKFKLDNYKIITNGSLHKIKDPSLYDLVIVDEAHKFRSDTASMYNDLQKLCKTKTLHADGSLHDKKVILVSATPLNNRPEDIANLVYLFQDSKDSTLEEGNLQRFFREQIDKYKKVKKQKDIEQISKEIKAIYEKIRTKVVEPLTVRRTRTDLMENEAYRKDLEEQNVHFPDVKPPHKIYYQLDAELEALYDKTIHYLGGKENNVLKYYRYQAIKYLVPKKKAKYKKADMISIQLAGIMKTLLVKRIDSSFYAFKQSLKRYYQANKVMLGMFEKGVIYIAPNLKVNELLSEGKEEELIQLIEEAQYTDPTIEICTPEDFEPGFKEGLEDDGHILEELVEAWNKITYDPKLDIFINEYLKSKLFDKSINQEGKLVVFSESKETTKYLSDTLKANGFNRVLTVQSDNRNDKMPVLEANFDANYKGEKKNDYNIVISTEVLAEGVNLHRANVIVNYDTPWNSTRLMQRIGRVNRIGSTAKEVHIFNFFPTAKVNNDIELEKKAKMKLFAFHAALGEDSQIYSTDENPESFGLFDKNADEERDEKLRYLMWLRKLKEDDPDLIKRICKMPLRARVGRKSKLIPMSTIAFIRNKRRDAFTFIREDGSIEELTFLEAVKEFEARLEEQAVPLHDKHHEQVAKAIEVFSEKEEDAKAATKKVITTQGPNEKKALAYLDGFLHVPNVTDEELTLIEKAKRAISTGKFQQLQRDINKLQSATKKAPVKIVVLLEQLMRIITSYPLEHVELNTHEIQGVNLIKATKELVPEIIISESFNF
ncbi:helicase-related protein [Parabacteroides merdae]|mgnify:FL=1|jgi:superfamily II DNA/RNA helicase|uniref:helicase-related protein n=1 Tax=Bacteroidales TaxID=171549 RepID=UPI000E48DAE5|nr:helicase-related protein [Bacteroides sp. OF04-15BH]RHP60891.1 helicase [Bacteroides sp. OF04-15BH]